MNKITENWYNQIILLSEAYPLSQAKYYSSLEKKVNEELVQPIWDRIVQLGDFTSKRKERVYFKLTAASDDIIPNGLVHRAYDTYGDTVLKLAALLELGLSLKNLDQQHQDISSDVLEMQYRESVSDYDILLNEEVDERYDYSDIKIYLHRARSYFNLFDNIVEEANGRKTKVGKIVELLSKKHLPPNLASILRQAYSKYNSIRSNMIGPKVTKEYYIVISRHPYDVAGMSSGRGWTSCMTLPGDPKKRQGGVNVRFVKCDVKEGTFIAYLINQTDLNIKSPVGRILIKPYYNSSKNSLTYEPEAKVYGTVPSTFEPTVRGIIEQATSKESLQPTIYRLAPTLYPDTPRSLTYFPTRAGGLEIKDIELENIEIVSKNLDDIKFINSKIHNTKFGPDVSLKRAQFLKDTLLSTVTFKDCDLENADFTNTKLWNVTFEECQLTGVNFSNLYFTENSINIKNSPCTGIVLSHATISPAEQLFVDGFFDHAKLDNARIYRGSFYNCSFESADFTNTLFYGINLKNANFKGANLTGVEGLETCKNLEEMIVDDTTILPKNYHDEIYPEYLKRRQSLQQF